MSKMLPAHLLPKPLRLPEVLLAVCVCLLGVPDVPSKGACSDGGVPKTRKRGRPAKGEEQLPSGDGPRQNQRRKARYRGKYH
eukprot:Skav205084  [mRNA]  locus=scaffold5280:37817:38062:+ [translate_table: standard]